MSPSSFTPRTAADFLGAGPDGAGSAAKLIEALVAQMRADGNASRAFLFNGRPGIGKSSLARWLIHDALGCASFSVTKLNGTSFNLERVSDLTAGLPYRDLYSAYKAIWVDEFDAMTRPAQVAALSLLDEMERTPGTVLIGTSNCKLTDFESRLTSRFITFELQPPTTQELTTFLGRFIRHPQAIAWIATGCGGNVRQALKDADKQYAVEQQATHAP